MIRAWYAAHRSVVATAVIGIVIVALVATIAIVSNGYSQQRVTLDDASVWVTNESTQMIGRANTQIHSLNSVVTEDNPTIDVAQRGRTVLALDHGDNTVSLIDAATATAGKAVALPPRSPKVGIAGSRAVIESDATGQVWLVPTTQLGDFNASATATVDLGGRIVTSLDADGTFFAYSAQAGTMYKLDAATADTVASTTKVGSTGRSASARAASPQLTSVGGDWALYSPDRRTVRTADGTRTLPAWLGSDATVQQPSTVGDTLYVASSSGLVAVPMSGGSVRTITRGELGDAASPLERDGCVYAAWAGGRAWSDCGQGGSGHSVRLADMPPGAKPVFRVNGDLAVLNDQVSGTSWAVQHGNALIDNWDDFAKDDRKTKRAEENTQDTPPTYEKTQQPPVAVDDRFGARPGVTSPLPVLLNDYDPNGDVLVIDSVDPIPAIQGTVQKVDDGQQLQIALPANASGQISFGYTVSDGRGGADTANVTVTVRTPNENSAPVQARKTKATVGAGGRVTTQVLGDWYDPDGDPFYLTSAAIDPPDVATSTPQGSVAFMDAGDGGTVKNVGLIVSDGRAVGAGTLAVTVHPADNVPIIIDPFVEQATTGDEITIKPLAHVRGGTGQVRLSAVPEKADVSLTPDFDQGSFRFSSDVAGTHYVDFTVTDGVSTASGVVRVEVTPPADAGAAPITVPHTAFIQEQSAAKVDVLQTDFDPAGGVLIITGATPPAAATGVRVEVLEQRILRVTLTRPLQSTVTFGYTVSNGLAQTTGTVRIVQIPRPATRQPPIANPDTVTVRVGDTVDIPVLSNDVQPDGDDLTLDPTLVTALPRGAGLLFASGNILRYLAPKKPGDYTAQYRVNAPDGQWATAQVTIAVRELDAASNRAPAPETVTARVLAGDTVRIPIPLSGTDPDGDSVKLVGQETNPEKGAVTRVGPDWLEYQAGSYAAGTDTFQYSVVDALGAHASGTVRVGIAPAQPGAHNPVAVEDEIVMRPGRTASVQVLANDSDPDNSPLEITKVQRTGAAGPNAARAKIAGDVVRVTAPKVEGRYGFIYQVQNDRGGTSSNFLTVVVRKNAPLARPQVHDTVLGLSDILGHKSLNVDVLANVFFADGPVSSLGLSVLPGYSHGATVTAKKHIRVTIGNESQIIPFQVSHPEDRSIVSYGFIWVPGFDDALPQLRVGAPKLTVPSEKPLTIDLNDYVVAVGGKKVRLTDSSHVHATHANGAGLVRNDHTLVYTSEPKYFGPASISFEVTDGASQNAPGAHVATLVLPISVTARQNQPPVFQGAQVDFEPGQQKTLDLVKLTSYPYEKDQAELGYRILDPKPANVSASITGQDLSLTIGAKVKKGTTLSVLIGVKDALNDGQSGRIDVTVVPSTRPIAVPQPDTAIARRGATTSVNVLANDGATNPFPSTPLTVIAVRGADSASLPSGVSITPSADKSRLNVSVSSNARPVDSNIQYEVADATGDPGRYAWGTVRISVQDRPEPVSNVRVTGVSDRALRVAWNAGAFNNSPIRNYDVTLTRAGSGAVVGTTTCAATTCTVRTPGNGPGNAVVISVAARNGIGLSDAARYADPVWSNIAPPAPTNLRATPGDGSVHVTWTGSAAGSGASAVTQYRVTVGDVTTTVGGSQTSADVSGLPNGKTVGVTVAALNDFYGAQPAWNVAGPVSATPAGAPIWTSAPTANGATNGSGTISIGWAGAVNDNGSAISSYTVAISSGGSPGCGGSGPDTQNVHGTSTTVDVNPGTTCQIRVSATNGVDTTASSSVTAVALAKPGAVTGISVREPSQADDDGAGHFNATLDGFDRQSVPDGTVTYEYRFPSGAGGSVDTDAETTLVAGASDYGRSVSVSVRAVAHYGDVTLAGAWTDSSAFVPVDANSNSSYQTDGDTDSFSWSTAPSGTGYTAVEYLCTGMTTWTTMPQNGSCPVSGLLPTMTVRVSANGTTYETTYRK